MPRQVAARRSVAFFFNCNVDAQVDSRRLLPEEEPGLGLPPPSITHPILQTYIDVCITSCLEHGDDFAREFISTTFLWTPYWLNDREIARRP